MSRVLFVLAAVVVTLVLLAVAWVYLRYPRTAPPPALLPTTEADLARGQYLFEHVLGCHDCHSERDWRFYAGPVVPRTAAGGAWVPDRVAPTHSANLTPFALRDWTDGEIFRAIAGGVNRTGQALHPLMPSDTYRKMTAADLRSVVAYLRTLPSVARERPQWRARSIPEFLLVRIVGRTLPQPYVAQDAPVDDVARGRALASMADCHTCHGTNLAGGRTIRYGPEGKMTALAPNLTPDVETGIGAWSQENFIAVFRSFRSVASHPVPALEKNTPMPWLRFSAMTEGDLAAIYRYTRSVPPVSTPVREGPK